MLTTLAAAVPARWGHRIARAFGLTDAHRVLCSCCTWDDWEDET